MALDEDFDEFGNRIEEYDYEYTEGEEEEEEEEGEGGGDDGTTTMLDLISEPSLVRNAAVIGHLNHGKTAFLGMLDNQGECNPLRASLFGTVGTMGAQIQTRPISMVLKDTNSKCYVCNFIDSPGDVSFSDEMSVALRLADGAVLVVDAADGIMVNTVRAIQHAVQEHLPIVVVINKVSVPNIFSGYDYCLVCLQVDRLITELNLSPKAAFNKLLHIVKGINDHITAVSSTVGGIQAIDPLVGNVCFASAKDGWSFTLHSFAKLHVKLHQIPLDAGELASRLWRDVYYNPDTGDFKGTAPTGEDGMTFLDLVLESLYKIYGHVREESVSRLRKTMSELGGKLTEIPCGLDFFSLLKFACISLFGSTSGFMEMLVNHIPSAEGAAVSKISHIYRGPRNSPVFRAMMDCNSSGPLMVDIIKHYPNSKSGGFDAFGRVYSGEIQTGQTVHVCSTEDEDLRTPKEVTNLWVYQGFYRLPITHVPAGSLVLIEGVDASIMKTATLCNVDTDAAHIFSPLCFNTISVVKMATKLLDPDVLPQMAEALRMINKRYPLAFMRAESSTYTISGTGELYLDAILRDLQELCSDVKFEVLSPVVSFCETVEGASGIEGCAETQDKKSKITMIAEPLNKGLAEDIENGVVSIKWSCQRRAEFLHTKYGWGMREASSIWAFGPDERGPNMLLDGTVEGEVDMNLLEAMKDFIVQGFQWAAKEGPLCAEPMRSVKFKIVVAQFEPGVLPADIICATRRAACAAFLMATPRLMEPIYSAEIQALKSNELLINSTLGRRAKNIACHAVEVSTVEHNKFTIYKAFIPVRACFGMADDLRIIQWSLSCQLVFNHWELVAGDEAKLIKEIGHQKGKDMNIREYVNEDMPTEEGADAELYTLRLRED